MHGHEPQPMIPLVVIVGALGFTLVLARLGRERVKLADGEGARFGGFNALRALAALGVVAGHTLTTSPLTGVPHFVVGNLATGVALFFVISGFLLYRPFAKSLGDRKAVNIKRFAANRALRILPLYVVVVIVVFLATEAHPAHSLLRLASALSFTGVYVGDDVLPVAWSLDDEVTFYFLLPLLFLALTAWPRQSQRLWLGAGAIAVLMIASLVALAARPEDQGINGGPLTKFHLFGLGMLLATVHTRWPRFELPTQALALGGVITLGALSVSTVAYDRHAYLFNPMCGVAFFVLVGMVAFSGPLSRFTRALSWGPLSHLGDVSYGIYLWHEPVHHTLFNSGVLSTSYIVDFMELSMCTVALATGTYYLVEKPALRIKNRWVKSSPPVPPSGRPPLSTSLVG